MTAFGPNLRRLRRSRGLSQTQMAVALGLRGRSKGYISELELGRKSPTAKLLETAADYFDVSVDELLGRASKQERPGSPDRDAGTR